jgi:hypothetical protein
MNAPKYGGNPVSAERAVSAAAIARVASNTRRRKWWLYVKLSVFETQLGDDAVHPAFPELAKARGITSKADVEALRPVKLPVMHRIAELFGSDRAKAHRVVEAVKKEKRAELARAWWWRELVEGTEPTKGRRGEYKPAPRDFADPATAEVREYLEMSGDVMLATWCGPEGEYSEPTW